MEEKKLNTEKKASKNQLKEIWRTPEVVDLNINEGTQNVVRGPGNGVGDGGPSFTDYNS